MLKHILLSLVLLSKFSLSQSINKKAALSEPSFKEGEWFQLRLHYGPFNASYATLSLKRDTVNGIPVFHAKGFGETTGIL